MVTEQVGRKVHEAAAAYRELLLLQDAAAAAERALERLEFALSAEDHDDFVGMTMDLDRALDRVDQEARLERWAPSTRRQRVRAALAAAGRGQP